MYSNLTQTLVFSVTFFLLTVGLGASAFAQSDLDALLESGIEDANKLVEGYTEPFIKTFGYGLANGWNNSAKPHKQFGVDITATVNLTYVPDEDLFYDIAGLGLQNVELSPSTSGNLPSGQAPTIFGPEVSPEYRSVDDPSIGFTGPEGLDWENRLGVSFVPVPMVQLGIGVVKNTDIKVRFFPNTDVDETQQIKMIGFGVLHDIKQWIPRLKETSIDLSGFVGFTDLSVEVDLSDQNISNSSGQRGIFDINVLTIQGLISKEFSLLTLYGGLGYNSVRSDLKLKGEYDWQNDGFDNDPVEIDPLSLSYTASGPRITAGARLKLAIITLHADYTLQEYDVLSVGFGIWVR